jgi:hypothetical protein
LTLSIQTVFGFADQIIYLYSPMTSPDQCEPVLGEKNFKNV